MHGKVLNTVGFHYIFGPKKKKKRKRGIYTRRIKKASFVNTPNAQLQLQVVGGIGIRSRLQLGYPF